MTMEHPPERDEFFEATLEIETPQLAALRGLLLAVIVPLDRGRIFSNRPLSGGLAEQLGSRGRVVFDRVAEDSFGTLSIVSPKRHLMLTGLVDLTATDEEPVHWSLSRTKRWNSRKFEGSPLVQLEAADQVRINDFSDLAAGLYAVPRYRRWFDIEKLDPAVRAWLDSREQPSLPLIQPAFTRPVRPDFKYRPHP